MIVAWDYAMKIIEFLQKIGITNFGVAAENHCGTGDTSHKSTNDVKKSKQDDSACEDRDPSPL